MKYFEVNFKIQPLSQDARDILAALSGDAGFETFEDTDEGLKGYVQQSLFDEEALHQTLQFFPMENIHIIYNIAEAEDKDWNEQWEQEGFEPIVIGDNQIIIHDGRHLPEQSTAQIAIEIDAHLAFGTGTHETTQMVCATLLEESLNDKNILDAGCGTGILGIAALKLGAKSVTAYDIDEWSADNTRHNAVINQVDEHLKIHCGDASLLDTFEERFDYVLANINRNILLNDMERFRKVMKPQGTLIMSGFYTEDIPLLESKGKELGLNLIRQQENNHWACILMREP
ncbi:MAG: 50S ribosomal protein L11 methyltransferase [Prevotella sp.]|nr:50S ribosomal protein L11 methyltransferase [Prevotella sp.]